MKSSLGAILFLSLMCSACVDTSSPKLTIASAVDSVEKNNLDDLKSILTDEALKSFGTDDGLKTLKSDLAGYKNKNLSVGVSELKSENKHNRYYQETLYGQKDGSNEKLKIWSLELTCAYWIVLHKSPDCQPGDPSWPSCNTFPPEPQYDERENCSIQKITRGQ